MSTKITLSHGKDFHLFQEVCDVKSVYLTVDNHEFEANKNRVSIQIPIQVWEKMVEEWPKNKARFYQENDLDWGHDTLEWLEFGSNATSQDETIIFERKK